MQIEKLDGLVRFMVKDSGVGMDETSINKILAGESFTKLGTSKEKGHGIGLTVVQEFIKKHGGILKVQSESGTGWEF